MSNRGRTIKSTDLNTSTEATSEKKRSSHRFSWRTLGSVILVVLATLVTPVAIVAGWARAELVEESKFVSTFAPLVNDEDVQAEIASQTSAVIIQGLELDALVENAFDGIQSLDLPQEAKSSLSLLRSPAVQGTHSLIEGAVLAVVSSDTFEGTWRLALRSGHQTFVAAASGTAAGGAISVDQDGAVAVPLGPIVAQVKESLEAQGFTLAEQIPPVDTVMVLAQSDSLSDLGSAYRMVLTVGWLLPLLALGLLLGGIALARDRRRGGLGAGFGLIIGGALTLVVFAFGQHYLVSQADVTGMSPEALESVYSQLVGSMRATASAVLVVGVFLAALMWVIGGSPVAASIRDLVQSGTNRAAASVVRHGFDGGFLGRWVYSHARPARIVLAVLVVVALLVVPTNPWSVFGTAVVCLLIWWLLEAFQKAAELSVKSGLTKSALT